MSEKKGLFGFLKGWGVSQEEVKVGGQTQQLQSEESGQVDAWVSSGAFEEKAASVVSPEIEEYCLSQMKVLLSKASLEGKVKLKASENNKIQIDIFDTGEDVGRLIGKAGATLDAFQILLRGFVSQKFGVNIRISVDAEEYKHKRFSKVKSTALKAAESVMKHGRKITLEPMSASDRRAVHVLFEKDKNIQTISEGEGHSRRISLVRRGRSGRHKPF